LNDKQANLLRIAVATLLALILLPVAWYAVSLGFVRLGYALGGEEMLEAMVKVSWFVGPPVGGFVALWAAGVLVRGAPLHRVFQAFSAFVLVMFVMGVLALYLGAGMTEGMLILGMFGQLFLVLGAAWAGKRVAERARGSG
jgi:hypothetical protein